MIGFVRRATLVVSLAVTAGVRLGTAQDIAFPDTPGGEVLQALVAAFNSGDTSRIRAFVERHVSRDPDRTANAVGYWHSVYQELGPISLRGVGDDGVFWCRGRITGAWVGINLRVGDKRPYQILRSGVRRMPVSPRVAPPRAAVPERELADSLSALLRASAAAGHFSGAVIVAKGGEPLFQHAHGYADRRTGLRNTLDTPFRLASVTKMFTGVAISQLAERGLLALDDPIQGYIPEYPEHIGRQVTLHHLLTHTSGIEIDDDPEFNAAVVQAQTVDDLLATQLRFIERLNLGNYEDFEPLGRYDYTNEGIDLLGVIVERVSGQPWAEYIRQHVFEPAGMASAGVDYLDPPALATPYASRGDRPGAFVPGERREITSDERIAGAIRPAGTGYASAPDMIRFMDALWNGTLLGEASTRRMTSPQIDQGLPPQLARALGMRRHYGYTIDITEYAGGYRAVGHTGGAPGVSTAVFRYPEADMTVVILSNFDRGGWWVQQRVQEMIFGVTERE